MKINKSLIKGSFILLISFGLFNFFNFLFQLTMARMLLVAEFGILATLSAIIYVFLIFSESIQTIITKYSAKEHNKGKLKNILKKSFKKAFIISLSLFIVYLLISIPLSFILKINYLLLSFNGLMLFLVFFIPITRGVLQGKERFRPLGANMILEASGKLILGILFVFIGWKVYGAIAGIIVGGTIAFIMSFIPLRDIIKSKEEKAKTIGIYNYAKPAFLITSIVIVFYSLDIIIAKIFFSPDIAGAYAISSILSKTIIWGTLPISKAMFPMSARNKKNTKKSQNIFLNALSILSLVLITALIIFYFFPNIIVKIFSGRFIPEAASILFYLVIGNSLIALTNLTLLYKLSLGKVRGYPYLLLFILIEIILLSYFSANLLQFSIAFITSSIIFLWGSIVLLRE